MKKLILLAAFLTMAAQCRSRDRGLGELASEEGQDSTESSEEALVWMAPVKLTLAALPDSWGKSEMDIVLTSEGNPRELDTVKLTLAEVKAGFEFKSPQWHFYPASAKPMINLRIIDLDQFSHTEFLNADIPVKIDSKEQSFKFTSKNYPKISGELVFKSGAIKIDAAGAAEFLAFVGKVAKLDVQKWHSNIRPDCIKRLDENNRQMQALRDVAAGIQNKTASNMAKQYFNAVLERVKKLRIEYYYHKVSTLLTPDTDVILESWDGTSVEPL